MARKERKGKVQHNGRVRFLQLDYYRYLATCKTTKIQGIYYYLCMPTYINIQYDSGLTKTYDVHEGEHQLKHVIKVINAYIGGNGDGAQ